LLTTAVEAHDAAVLREDFNDLPPGDRRRRGFFQLDDHSSVWVTLLPDDVGYLGVAEFPEVVARYLFLPSPALRPHVGKPIHETRRRAAGLLVCDPYGDNLGLANLCGDGHSTYHDGCQAVVHNVSASAGVKGHIEVFDLFRPLVPQRGTREALKKQVRGCIPDLILDLPIDQRGTGTRETLLEVKVITFCPTRYTTWGLSNFPGAAVNKRAEGLPEEYDKLLSKADITHCGTPPPPPRTTAAGGSRPGEIGSGPVGPMRQLYRSFGRLRGLVFGWFGEVSDDVRALENTLAHVAAVREAMLTGAKSETKTAGRMKWHIRRQIGAETARLRARHLLDRKMYIGGTSARRAGGGRFGGDATGEGSQYFAASSARAAAAQKTAQSDGAGLNLGSCV
jgi:hypothetical protein